MTRRRHGPRLTMREVHRMLDADAVSLPRLLEELRRNRSALHHLGRVGNAQEGAAPATAAQLAAVTCLLMLRAIDTGDQA